MKPLVLIPLFCILIPSLAQAEVDFHESSWGEMCDQAEDSYAIKLVNNTEESVDYRVCLEHLSGNWTCFVASDVAKGTLGTEDWSHHICDASGESSWWWRDAGDYSESFPNPIVNKNKDA